MRIFYCGLCLLALNTPLWACPDGAETLVSCTLKNGARSLQTCLDGAQAVYAFGNAGQPPELSLEHPVRKVDMTPWPGVGGSIWEEVIFRNRDVLYVVYYNLDRDPGAAEPLTGGVIVEQNGKELAHLKCDPGSVASAGYSLPLFEAKIAAGQKFSIETGEWE